MIEFYGCNYEDVEDIRKYFVSKYLNGDIAPNGTIQLLGRTFIANEQYIFHKPSQRYLEAEKEWYLNMSLCVDDIPMDPIPKIWDQICSDSSRTINSNYGWMVFSKENGVNGKSQFENVIDNLKQDINSRQGVIIYMRPSMHNDWNEDGRRDFTCTYNMNIKFIENKLIGIVNMRSNDIWGGFPYDLAWAQYVLEKAAKELGVEFEPNIIWSVDDIHCYERNFKDIKNYIGGIK